MNKLYFGDNLEILQQMMGERTHFIRTDPFCNSKREYNTLQ